MMNIISKKGMEDFIKLMSVNLETDRRTGMVIMNMMVNNMN